MNPVNRLPGSRRGNHRVEKSPEAVCRTGKALRGVGDRDILAAPPSGMCSVRKGAERRILTGCVISIALGRLAESPYAGLTGSHVHFFSVGKIHHYFVVRFEFQ